jgi:hypothetical protein
MALPLLNSASFDTERSDRTPAGLAVNQTADS